MPPFFDGYSTPQPSDLATFSNSLTIFKDGKAHCGHIGFIAWQMLGGQANPEPTT
jgi:hypothetical protein